MAYLNFNQLQRHLKRGDFELLVAVKQTDTEYLINELTEDDLNRFKTLDFISEVKGKKKGDHPYKSLRASDKLKKYLTQISYEGSPDSESEALSQWAIGIYKKKSGGIIRNKTELTRRLHWFKTITGISGNYLALLMQCFFADTYDDTEGISVRDFMDSNPRGVLSNIAENMFWTPANHFARHYVLSESPLHNYYEDNIDFIKAVWEKNLNEDGKRK